MMRCAAFFFVVGIKNCREYKKNVSECAESAESEKNEKKCHVVADVVIPLSVVMRSVLS